MSTQKKKLSPKDRIIAMLIKKNQLLLTQLKEYQEREEEIDELKAEIIKKGQKFERINRDLAKQNKKYMEKLKELKALKRNFQKNTNLFQKRIT